MKRLRRVIPILIAAHLSAAMAWGQVKRGVTELNVSGGLDASSVGGDTYTSLNLQLSAGRFVSDTAQLGANWQITKFEGVDAFGTISGFGAYHFQKDRSATAVPYAGVEAGFMYGPGDSVFQWGLFGGLKTFVAGGGGAFIAQPYFRQQRDSGITVSSYGVDLGVAIFLGR